MKKPTNAFLDINSLEIPEELIAALIKAASDVGIKRIALVGGAVRDMLIKQTDQSLKPSLKDLDVIVEGSAIELAKSLQKNLIFG